MNLTERILSAIDRAYDKKSRSEFQKHFEKSVYGDQLNKPILTGNFGERKEFKNISDVPLHRATCIRIKNRKIKEIKIDYSVDVVGQANTVEELFDRFVRCSLHSNPLGDFRDNLNPYDPVYSRQYYFAIHGDGHCVALGLLFQSLCREVLGEEVVLNYCFSDNRQITHVYGRYISSGGLELYVDPDQKTLKKYTDMENSLPHAFLFFMISGCGLRLFERLILTGKEWLFPAISKNNFARIAGSEMTIYHNSPTIESESKYFNEARKKNNQILDIELDDYLWKKVVRSFVAKNNLDREAQKTYFLADIDLSVVFCMRANSELEIGFSDREYPAEIIYLFLVFFGRAPATIWLNAKKGCGIELRLPAFPWFIVTEKSISTIRVNNKEFSLSLSDCGKFKMLGMGDLEEVLPIFSKKYTLVIEAHEDCDLGVGIPINAFAFNSGLASFYTSERICDDALILADLQ